MNFVIVENKKNNYMIEVGSIVTVDLLISDKPSVSKLCGYRLHSVRPSLYGGKYMYMQEVHVHAGTEEVLCPLDLDQMEILLDGMRLSENPCWDTPA